MAKAKSGKSVGTGGGFFDDPVAWIKETADEMTKDIPLIQHLKTPDERVAAAEEKAAKGIDTTPKPEVKKAPPIPVTETEKGKEVKRKKKEHKKKLDQMSKEQIEEIHRRLAAGEKVKAE